MLPDRTIFVVMSSFYLKPAKLSSIEQMHLEPSQIFMMQLLRKYLTAFSPSIFLQNIHLRYLAGLGIDLLCLGIVPLKRTN